MAKFIAPMLAQPIPEGFDPKPGEWVAEEKLDGHRMIVSVAADGGDLFGRPEVVAWSRNGIRRDLPPHVEAPAGLLPSGVYDCELMVPGKRSYGVTELTESPNLVLYLFDVLELMGATLVHRSLHDRMAMLATAYGKAVGRARMGARQPLRLCEGTVIHGGWAQVRALASEIWARDGEGMILKKLSRPYSSGKRPKDAWYKVKQLRTAVLRVSGFAAGRGQFNEGDPCAAVFLTDDDGNVTSVKTLNEAEREKLAQDPKAHIGRGLRIDYQERTPDGNYRHPRWDRWEDE